MQLRKPNWNQVLIILLVVLASIAIIYIAVSVLSHFRQAILLFTLGAILAYILTPLVNRLEDAFHFRWLGILLAYSLIAAALFALGVLLFTPFVDQSRSLVDNLHTPATSSLGATVTVENEAAVVQKQIDTQRHLLNVQSTLARGDIQTTTDAIARLQSDVRSLATGTVSGVSHSPRRQISTSGGRLPPNPQPQTSVPPSYVQNIQQHTTVLATHYRDATAGAPAIDGSLLSQAESQAIASRTAAKDMYHTMSTTPILLLRSQTWLDQHGIRIDLHDKFGQAAQQISNQGTSILDNAITILSETANILLNITLILIISFYLLSDGRRMIHRGLEMAPSRYREQIFFFVTSLDRVLGGYIRGQLFLSLLAGILGGGGAAFLGVPYPLLIGIVTFILESVPVIGPLVAVFPAAAISLFFMPFVTTVLLVVWFLIFQQLVTNILGPRIMGMAVGIHPLEALLAVLVGFPLGGFLGAFLAVPVMGILHILLREAYGYFVHGQELSRAAVPAEVDAGDDFKVVPPVTIPPKSDPATR